MPDKVLDDTFVELTNAFGSSGITFKKLPVDLGRPGYLEIIARATAGLDITLVFNNAGYILTGFFDKTPLDRIMANVECNALAGVQISHHFVTQMIQKKQRGAICSFPTSKSDSCFMPGAPLKEAGVRCSTWSSLKL